MAKKVKKSKPIATKKGRSLKLSKKNKIILGSLLMLFSIALFFSFVSFYFTWQADQSLLSEFSDRNEQAKNLLNKFGASISHFFVYKGFGLASLIFTFLFFITGLHLFLSLDKKGLLRKWIWGLIFIIWISITLGFFAEKRPLLGGIVGYEMNDFLQDYTGKIGVFLLLLFGLTVIFVRLFQFTPETIINYFKQKSSSLGTDLKTKPSKAIDQSDLAEVLPEKEEAPQVIDTYTHKKDIPPLQLDDTEDGFKVEVGKSDEEDDIAMEVEKIKEEVEDTDLLSNKLVEDFGEFDPTLELGNYKFPTIELLDQHGVGGGITINQEELEENKNKIVETLRNYKIGIAQIKATIGPTVTLYEIVPEAGVRISKIKNLEDDIALSLAALGIRIIAPIPGKGTIGIEVPNKNATIVSMRSVIASPKFQKAEMELPIAFGKTISNETFVVDLAKIASLINGRCHWTGKICGIKCSIDLITI
jgi:S-DNA-T family DNA segregation ATPase FtsK/SpoIIIE